MQLLASATCTHKSRYRLLILVGCVAVVVAYFIHVFVFIDIAKV